MTLLYPATVSPFFPTSRPFSLHAVMTCCTRAASAGSFVILSLTSSMPARRPLPRTSPTAGCSLSGSSSRSSRSPSSRSGRSDFVLHQLQVFQSKGAGCRIASECIHVPEAAVRLTARIRLKNLPFYCRCRQRQISARNAFCHCDDVR